jgi:hypothetical protein
MSDHRPNVTLSLDVFVDGIDLAGVENPTPAQVAAAAWTEIERWLHDGYQPVVEVTMPDESTYVIDLGKEGT